MKDSTLILTEQRQFYDEPSISTLIQQDVTASLTKELTQ